MAGVAIALTVAFVAMAVFVAGMFWLARWIGGGR